MGQVTDRVRVLVNVLHRRGVIGFSGHDFHEWLTEALADERERVLEEAAKAVRKACGWCGGSGLVIVLPGDKEGPCICQQQVDAVYALKSPAPPSPAVKGTHPKGPADPQSLYRPGTPHGQRGKA